MSHVSSSSISGRWDSFHKGAGKWMLRLAWAQGLFYFVTGIWPILHIESFMMVTGPKTDHWLVKTVGVMIVASSLVMIISARHRDLNRSVAWLAALNALGLAGVDIYYNLRDVIPPVYLLDALVEIPIALIWLGYLFRRGVGFKEKSREYS